MASLSLRTSITFPIFANMARLLNLSGWARILDVACGHRASLRSWVTTCAGSITACAGSMQPRTMVELTHERFGRDSYLEYSD